MHALIISKPCGLLLPCGDPQAPGQIRRRYEDGWGLIKSNHTH